MESIPIHYKVYGREYKLIPLENIFLDPKIHRDSTVLNTIKWYKIKNDNIKKRYPRNKKRIKKKTNVGESIDIEYMIKFFNEKFPLPPILVNPEKNGKFSIIDGRHRTTVSFIMDYTHIPVKIINKNLIQYKKIRNNNKRKNRERYKNFIK